MNFTITTVQRKGDILGYVNVLVADRDNNLWIGTNAGLFCYSGNKLVKISASSGLPEGVSDILLESDGTAWLATENGPVKTRLDKTRINKAQGERRIDFIK